MACNKCDKNSKSTCSCKKKSVPYCGDKPETCHNSELYQWCDKTEKCPETTCGTECSIQVDTREVFYNLKATCYSGLAGLGIPNGSDMSYVLEKMAKFIQDNNYIDVSGNRYGVSNFRDYMLNQQVEMEALAKCCNDRECENKKLLADVASLKSRLEMLEFPQTVDSRGLGFVKTDGIRKILQTLADKP